MPLAEQRPNQPVIQRIGIIPGGGICFAAFLLLRRDDPFISDHGMEPDAIPLPLQKIEHLKADFRKIVVGMKA